VKREKKAVVVRAKEDCASAKGDSVPAKGEFACATSVAAFHEVWIFENI
jgi:hypothetical protein